MIRTVSRGLTLRKLEWLGVLLPLSFLGFYHYVILKPGHDLFHSAWGIVVLVASLGLAVVLFSLSMFRAIGRLQRDVQELSRVTVSQNAQLRALNEANLGLSQETSVWSVLQRVVDLSRELAGADYAALGVLGDDGTLRSFLTSGIDDAARSAIGELPSGEGLLGLMLERSEPLRVDHITSHPASSGFPDGHPTMTSFLGVPIMYKEQVVGSLYLTEKEGGHGFTAGDEEIVSLFANQAAVAIHNAQLYEKIQALAVETERIRISREMHDGLAQVLGYLNTKAQAVEAFLANGELETAREHLGEMGDTARRVYRDIREGILALRTQVGSDRSLIEVLEEYLSEYEHQLGPSVRVTREFPEGLQLSPMQEVQVLRIVQESLTNVRKHAHATEVSIRLTEGDGELNIEIRDNGQGFNPLAVERGEWPHLGLQTMRERAEAIGGSFETKSSPGQGTTVSVSVPLALGSNVRMGDL